MNEEIEFSGRAASGRYFCRPGQAAARVRPGSSARAGLRANGDCTLLDFRSGVFAVSDASDRDPAASLRLLEELRGAVGVMPCPDQLLTQTEIEGFGLALTETVERIMDRLIGFSSCTLTCLKVFRRGRNLGAFLLHTGDSALFELSPDRGAITRLTRDNLWMVGRTANLFQSDTLVVKPGALYILATDGVAALRGSGRNGFLSGPALETDLGRLSRRLLETGDEHENYTDDGAVLILAPDRIQPSGLALTLGGVGDFVAMKKGIAGLERGDIYGFSPAGCRVTNHC